MRSCEGPEERVDAYHDIVEGATQVFGVVHQTEVGVSDSTGGKA
jgi:hypothetical protein